MLYKMKLTKRKQFAFYRSYYDVFNELSDIDKLKFIEALLDKQFLDKEPDNLSGMVKFAYISQMDSIDKQVKGYCDKTKTALNPNKIYPWQGVENNPMQGGKITPSQQEKEKEEEKEEYNTNKEVIFNHDNIDNFKEQLANNIKEHQQWIDSCYMSLGLRKNTISTLIDNYKNHLLGFNLETKKDMQDFKKHFRSWLLKEKRNNNLNDYLKR